MDHCSLHRDEYIKKKKSDSNFSPLFFICIMCCGVIKHPRANLQANKRDDEGEEGADLCERGGELLAGWAWSKGLQHPQPCHEMPRKMCLWV